MAIITTNRSLGWFGVHEQGDCSPFKLHEQLGTYTSNGAFQVGKLGLSESDASKIEVWTMLPSGTAWPWNLTMEKKYRFHPIASLQSLVKQHDELKCGQAYWIIKNTSKDINIPGFVPTAFGVDMGRITD